MYTQFFGNFLLSKSAVPADKRGRCIREAVLFLSEIRYSGNSCRIIKMLPRLTLLYAVRPMKIRNLVKLQSKADILQRNRLTNYSPRRNQTTCF